jgi:hypothetical protein
MLISVINATYDLAFAVFIALATIAIVVALSYATERRKRLWRTVCEHIATWFIPGRPIAAADDGVV